MIINGQEYQLNTQHYNYVRKMQRHGHDVYTLTTSTGYFPPDGNTRIFKGAEQIEINSKVYIPNVRYPGNGIIYNQGGDTVKLTDFVIQDFAVLDK